MQTDMQMKPTRLLWLHSTIGYRKQFSCEWTYSHLYVNRNQFGIKTEAPISIQDQEPSPDAKAMARSDQVKNSQGRMSILTKTILWWTSDRQNSDLIHHAKQTTSNEMKPLMLPHDSAGPTDTLRQTSKTSPFRLTIRWCLCKQLGTRTSFHLNLRLMLQATFTTTPPHLRT